MSSNAEVISALNRLIETCRDGQEGFKAAADGVRGDELKRLFREYSQQRARFAGELQQEVRRLGGEASEAGSVSAALHRGWMGLKSALTGEDDGAILAECERGEDSAVSSYRSALGTDLPAHVRSMVERQFSEVKQAHDRVRSLEKAGGANA
ncbi:MAG TPA: PA2169 family four-helix-bundle protein [Pyrinomonadaceae bacterium]|nr:PA2169 family four-helix-bundle protein [Pyrinomonadaceae bacterium]